MALPAPAVPLAPGSAQSLKGFQDAGQAFFPGAAAFEAGFYGGDGEGAWLASTWARARTCSGRAAGQGCVLAPLAAVSGGF